LSSMADNLERTEETYTIMIAELWGDGRVYVSARN